MTRPGVPPLPLRSSAAAPPVRIDIAPGVPAGAHRRLRHLRPVATPVWIDVAPGVPQEARDEQPQPAQKIRGLGSRRGGGAPGDGDEEGEEKGGEAGTKRRSAHGGLQEERSAGISMIPGAALQTSGPLGHRA